jgi:hypothetical protein
MKSLPRHHHDRDDAARPLCVAPTPGSLLHHVPGAVEIGVDDGVPALHREVDRGLRKLAAGAVDENVDAAEFRSDPVIQRRDRGRVADIQRFAGDLQAGGAHRRHRRVELGLVAPSDDHFGAEPTEQPGGGAADAAGSPGDENGAPIKGARSIDRRQPGEVGILQPEFARLGHWLSHGVPSPSAARRQ